ncbi:putative membrane protein [Chitinophaga skermanii]|uniref:Putative membrane protein n=1 Tax=Chitinophaga skermanii TaxID=331697 RepID=A0A327QKU2_9BACT|nr:DUF1361 domain-containing protein [Chitinophaga skermanii]RAJ03963.1 putative membrane protein [Chitinophaga skermanii]
MLLLKRVALLSARNKGFVYMVHAMSVFAVLQVAVRIALTGQTAFLGMVWNLFLAYIPFFLSNGLMKMERVRNSNFLLMLCTLAWVFFLPNAPYMLTDFLHFSTDASVPAWMDIILFFSFSYAGLMLCFISIKEIESGLRKRFATWQVFVFVEMMMILCAIGVYIGRYIRFNSWDVIMQPFELVETSWKLLFVPSFHSDFWAFTIYLTVLMSILYYATKKSPSL